MRARAAYITSFGTTGILVAAALLMLTLVSALVAFHAWPGSTPGESVAAVPLRTSPASAVQLADVRRVDRRVVRVHRPAASSRAPIARGVVKVPAAAASSPIAAGFVKTPQTPTVVPGRPPVGTPLPARPGAATAQAPTVVSSAPVSPQQPALPQLPALAGGGSVDGIVGGTIAELPPPPTELMSPGVSLPGFQPGEPIRSGTALGGTSLTVTLP